MKHSELVKRCERAALDVVHGNYFIDTRMKFTAKLMARAILEEVLKSVQEPSMAMRQAGERASWHDHTTTADTWKAMLAASPLAPEVET